MFQEYKLQYYKTITISFYAKTETEENVSTKKRCFDKHHNCRYNMESTILKLVLLLICLLLVKMTFIFCMLQ